MLVFKFGKIMGFKVKDHYYNKAKKDNFLARSIYKLEEIDKKFKVFKKSDRVIDLGYHPGSWIQYTSKSVSDSGRVVGIDIKPVNKKLNLNNVTLFEMDAFAGGTNDVAAALAKVTADHDAFTLIGGLSSMAQIILSRLWIACSAMWSPEAQV